MTGQRFRGFREYSRFLSDCPVPGCRATGLRIRGLESHLSRAHRGLGRRELSLLFGRAKDEVRGRWLAGEIPTPPPI